MFSIATKFSPISASFEQAMLAGFEYAELYMTPTRLMSWRSLSKIARSFECQYALHFPTEGKISDQTCEEISALAFDINAKILVIHPEQMEFAPALEVLNPDLKLAVENQCVGFDDLDGWIRSHDFVTLDIEHLWKHTLQDCDIHNLVSVTRSLLQKYPTQIRHIHLPGYIPGEAEQMPMHHSQDMVFAIFDLLFDVGYDGMVVGELSESFQTPLEMRRDLQLFETWKSKLTGTPPLDPIGTDWSMPNAANP